MITTFCFCSLHLVKWYFTGLESPVSNIQLALQESLIDPMAFTLQCLFTTARRSNVKDSIRDKANQEASNRQCSHLEQLQLRITCQ